MTRRRFASRMSAALAMVTAVAACGSSGSGGGAVGSVEIGVITPLTGGAASYGTQFWQAVQLAVGQVNDGGGVTVAGKKYRLHADVCDDQFVASKSVQCGRKLATENLATMIFTPASLSAFPLMGFNEQSKFILMATSQTPSFTTSGNKLVIRMINDTTQTMPQWVTVLHKYFQQHSLQSNSVALMQVNTELGASWAKVFTKAWSDQGGKITGSASYDANSTDFTNQLQSILPGHPQVIALTTVCQPSALVIKQARQMGYEGIFLNSAACVGGPALSQYISPSSLIGTLLTEANGASFPSTPGVAKFDQAFQSKYHQKPTETSAALGYQGIKWFALALQKAGTTADVSKIHQAFQPALSELGGDNLLSVQSYDPSTGQIAIKMNVGVTTPSGQLTPFSG